MYHQHISKLNVYLSDNDICPATLFIRNYICILILIEVFFTRKNVRRKCILTHK